MFFVHTVTTYYCLINELTGLCWLMLSSRSMNISTFPSNWFESTKCSSLSTTPLRTPNMPSRFNGSRTFSVRRTSSYRQQFSKKKLRFKTSFSSHDVLDKSWLWSASSVLPVFSYRQVTMFIIRFQDWLKRFGCLSSSSRCRLSTTSYTTSGSYLTMLSSDRHCIKPSEKASR